MTTTAVSVPATARAVPPALQGGRLKPGLNVRPSRLGLRIPPLRLIHRVQTPDQIARGWVPGHYGYGDHVMPAVTVIFLKVDEVRRLDRRHDGRVRTVCASADGIVPVPEVVGPPSDRCAACPNSEWTNGRIDPATQKPQRIPPPCAPGFAFLGALVDLNDAPFWFVCAGTAEQQARAFLEGFQNDPTVPALHALQVRLSSKPAEKGGLVWYLPVFEPRQVEAPALYGALAEHAADLRYVPFLGGRAGGEPAEAPPDLDDVPPPGDDDVPF
jgi:hypothetical protein